MGDKISAGTRLAQIPQDLIRGHHKRGKQRSGPMTDVFVLAFFRFAWRNGLRGVFAFKNLGYPRKARQVGVGHVLYGTKFNHEFSHPAEDRPTWDMGLKAA
jgi:hypothetical protein